LGGTGRDAANVECVVREIVNPGPVLTDGQAEVLRRSMRRPAGQSLLHGVTGSGKTEVYLRLAEDLLRANRQALCSSGDRADAAAGRALQRTGFRPRSQYCTRA
jgi:signal recognition particle GTPase